MLLHLGLQEEHGLVGMQPCRDEVRHSVERRLLDPRRVGVVGGQRMPVGDEVVTAILILQLHPVADGAEVVAKVDAARRSKAAEDVLRRLIH
jgi:hypothetical protein